MNLADGYELLTSTVKTPAVVHWNGILSWCGYNVELWWNKEDKKGFGTCKFFVSNKDRDDAALAYLAGAQAPARDGFPQLFVRNLNGVGHTISQIRIDKVEVVKTYFSECPRAIYHNIDFAFNHIEEF